MTDSILSPSVPVIEDRDVTGLFIFSGYYPRFLEKILVDRLYECINNNNNNVSVVKILYCILCMQMIL